MSQKLTLEQLVDAVRSAGSLGELKRMVGPSENEAEASRNRIALLDSISPACEWDSMTRASKRKRHASVTSVWKAHKQPLNPCTANHGKKP